MRNNPLATQVLIQVRKIRLANLARTYVSIKGYKVERKRKISFVLAQSTTVYNYTLNVAAIIMSLSDFSWQAIAPFLTRD